MLLRRAAYSVLGLFLLAALAYTATFEHWTVPDGDPALASSVEPALHAGDTVALLRRGPIAHGDLVRCVDPSDPASFVAGRVLGVAGDAIDIDGNGVRINGDAASIAGACDRATRVVKNPLGGEQAELDCAIELLGGHRHPILAGDRTISPTAATVDSGKLWLVSDDRRFHLDSRDFGAIERTTCARVVYILVGPAHGGEADRSFTAVP